jgi:hypothetical protein
MLAGVAQYQRVGPQQVPYAGTEVFMPSPFPGMDPYLEEERSWPEFQHLLVRTLQHVLTPSLPQGYQVHTAERRYDTGHGEGHEEYLEVRGGADGRLVTLLDIASPANKTAPAGRAACLSAQQQAMEAGANLVEVDLVLGGEPLMEYSRERLAAHDYVVVVHRAQQPGRYEVYANTLQKRLPRFRLPLGPADRDLVVDLQAVLGRCYEQGGFAGRIDYRRDPAVPLRAETRSWLAEFLRAQGLRGPGDQVPVQETGSAGEEPPQGEIALAAYYLWQREGCPPGRAQEHWYRALEELRRGTGL